MQVALFHGDNRLEIEEALSEALAHCEAEAGATLNRETFEPPLDFDAFRRAALTMPFLTGLGGKRILIARDVVRRGGNSLARQLVPLLDELPPSTCLLFAEFEALPANHPLLRWMKGHATEAVLRRFNHPKPKALPKWIAERVKRYGVTIDGPAAALLARQIGDDLLTLDQELRKLAIYRGGEGRIVREDVATLVPYTLSGDLIFKVVDAIGARNPRQALTLLHRMLNAPDAPHPWQVMAMVVRQFRLLVQARWLLDRGQVAALGEQLGLRYDFLVEKVRRQSTLFSGEQLHRAYRLLVEYDRAVKSGTLSIETALDLLVVQLTRL